MNGRVGGGPSELNDVQMKRKNGTNWRGDQSGSRYDGPSSQRHARLDDLAGGSISGQERHTQEHENAEGGTRDEILQTARNRDGEQEGEEQRGQVTATATAVLEEWCKLQCSVRVFAPVDASTATLST